MLFLFPALKSSLDTIRVFSLNKGAISVSCFEELLRCHSRILTKGAISSILTKGAISVSFCEELSRYHLSILTNGAISVSFCEELFRCHSSILIYGAICFLL